LACAALAAALITKPSVLLLDEPFGALDEIIREDIQRMLLDLHRINLTNENFPSTIVIVTHQLKEALFVADRIVGLSQHHPRAAELGATIVYDMPSLSSSGEGGESFRQEEQIRRVVYEPGSDNGDGKYIQPYLTPTVTGVK
jgi:sulfonate transport system ATP-binding protein